MSERDGLRRSLTALQWALIEVIEASPGIDEPTLARRAAGIDGGGSHGDVSHFAKALREGALLSLVRREREATYRYWPTEALWRKLGHDGPVPTSAQGSLL